MAFHPRPPPAAGTTHKSLGSKTLGSNRKALFPTRRGKLRLRRPTNPIHPEQATVSSRVLDGKSQKRGGLGEPLATFASPSLPCPQDSRAVSATPGGPKRDPGAARRDPGAARRVHSAHHVADCDYRAALGSASTGLFPVVP